MEEAGPERDEGGHDLRQVWTMGAIAVPRLPTDSETVRAAGLFCKPTSCL